jgi:5-methylcytosine-specific restriction enzyme A
MPLFGEVAESIDRLMGVKAVWGLSSEPVMCFGSRANAGAKDKLHFMQARGAAEKAIERPYLVTIGGGARVSDELRGRVLELVRVTGVYGETKAFVRDPELLSRLAQWPVAVVLSEVHTIEGLPRLIEDLGFSDRKILENAYDGIRRDEVRLAQLWKVLKDHPVSRRWDVRPLAGFRDPGRVRLCGPNYPNVSSATSEGRRIYKEMRVAERDRGLSTLVKEENRAGNGGQIVCDGCDFREESRAMFDAHHLDPLGNGPRWSKPENFAVLCPTCHRWSHSKADDALQPLPIPALRVARLGHPLAEFLAGSLPAATPPDELLAEATEDYISETMT